MPAPPLVCSVPWKYDAELFGMLLPSRRSVSFVTLAKPVAASRAPLAWIELGQPYPGAPTFPHGG